jgi:hypothetical protein
VIFQAFAANTFSGAWLIGTVAPGFVLLYFAFSHRGSSMKSRYFMLSLAFMQYTPEVAFDKRLSGYIPSHLTFAILSGAKNPQRRSRRSAFVCNMM